MAAAPKLNVASRLSDLLPGLESAVRSALEQLNQTRAKIGLGPAFELTPARRTPLYTLTPRDKARMKKPPTKSDNLNLALARMEHKYLGGPATKAARRKPRRVKPEPAAEIIRPATPKREPETLEARRARQKLARLNFKETVCPSAGSSENTTAPAGKPSASS